MPRIPNPKVTDTTMAQAVWDASHPLRTEVPCSGCGVAYPVENTTLIWLCPCGARNENSNYTPLGSRQVAKPPVPDSAEQYNIQR